LGATARHRGLRLDHHYGRGAGGENKTQSDKDNDLLHGKLRQQLGLLHAMAGCV
jgi:hypothetical protein